MKDLIVLLKRDFKNSINTRMLGLLGFMILLQVWFIMGSGSVKSVLETGEMHFMAIVFSFNLFGSIVALAFHFDSISTERENKTLDLILTSGISKRKVLLGKGINSFVVSLIFAALYVAVMFFTYLLSSKNPGISLLAFRYLIPITVFLFIYNLMGLFLSIVLRSSKMSLIISIILGGLFVPRLFLTVIDGLGKAIGFSQETIDIISMISPALIMNAFSGYEEKNRIVLGLIFFLVYLILMGFISALVFTRQDELNYGE